MTIRQTLRWIAPIILCLQSFLLLSDAFSSSLVRQGKGRAFDSYSKVATTAATSTTTWLKSAKTSIHNDDDVCTVQILMSDTGGGHRASANALEDALNVLYPGKFECDIVDLYMEYGPYWPYNDAVRIYKVMAEYSWMWDLFFRFGETGLGLVLNELILGTFCYESFTKCMTRTFESTQKRADMVVSVHPLCQDLPLKILADLDATSDYHSNEHGTRKTPFVTVVTDLGGAHKTWFNRGKYSLIGF